MKVSYKLVVLFTIFALAIAACGGGGAEPTNAPDTSQPSEPNNEPVVLNVGWAGSPDTLNPGTAVLAEAYSLFELIYDSMYQYNLDGTYSLELADSVDVSDDGTVWTFHIRDGVMFHDGTPLTANDVAFSYNLYQANEDFPFLNVYTGYFDSVEATDDSTVVITLSEAIPNMESQLYLLYVLPQHIWENVNPVEFENEEMIGSGPFKLVEYSPNEFARLETTGNHVLYSPNISGVIFRHFESQDALVQAIKTGQVDMITEVPPTTVASLNNDANIDVATGAPFYPYVADIIFNLVDDANCPPDDGVCSGHPALRDRNVRLALAHATDKQKIIDIVLLGLGDPGLTLIPNGLGPFYNNSIQDYAFDVDLANSILDNAGYLDTDNDGIREMPDGSQPLTFRMNYPSDSIDAPRESELLKEMWAAVGVNVEIQAFDGDTLTSVCCPAFDFDVILWGWYSDPDPGFLLSVMLTDEVTTGNSETGYSNPDYDALYTEQATELDFNKRKEIIWDMQQIVFDDVVYIIPFYSQTVQAYRTDRFTGWLTGTGKLALDDISSLIVIKPVE